MKIAVITASLFLVLVVIAVLFMLRWFRIRRAGGVNVALRWRPEDVRSGWHLGVGRYEGESFCWYRVWSLRTGADRVFARYGLEIQDRRDPSGVEAYAAPKGSVVLCCVTAENEPIELAMGPDALTGFLSWLEAAPPGRQVRRAS